MEQWPITSNVSTIAREYLLESNILYREKRGTENCSQVREHDVGITTVV